MERFPKCFTLLQANHLPLAAPDCVPNVCPCSNGPPKTGADCSIDGTNCVTTCSSGWQKNTTTGDCTVPKCSCANGVPSQGCTTPDQHKCTYCNADFAMYPTPAEDAEKCVAKLPDCVCATGVAGRPDQCRNTTLSGNATEDYCVACQHQASGPNAGRYVLDESANKCVRGGGRAFLQFFIMVGN